MAATSLTMLAPAASAARATPGLTVSIEIGTLTRPANCSITGITRRSSSASLTGKAPGRVDSPPTSMISAPCSTSCRACATAAGGSRNRPPSENESGVTFTMPITSAGRGKVNSNWPAAKLSQCQSAQFGSTSAPGLPIWINSISYPSGASMKAMPPPSASRCGPSEYFRPSRARCRPNSSRLSTSKARCVRSGCTCTGPLAG